MNPKFKIIHYDNRIIIEYKNFKCILNVEEVESFIKLLFNEKE